MQVKVKKSFFFVLAGIVFLLVAVIMASAAGQPGSDSDPLVTKSYVDQQIAQLNARIGSSGGTGGTGDSQAVDQLRTDVGDLTKFIIDALTNVESLKNRITTLEGGFAVLELKKGQKLLLSGGSEAIMRSGEASAIKGTDGTMIDISSGADLADGAKVVLQHLLISSRNDGRGLVIKSTNAFLLVRGAYSVK